MDWIKSIREFEPYNEQEIEDKKIILQCIDTFEDVLKRENGIAHITCTAFVVNKNRDKVLMVHHNLYNSWSLTGGHADGDGDLLAVAIKEVKEETGVVNVRPISSEIYSLDLLATIEHIKEGKYIAPHLHLSVSYLCEVDEEESLVIKKDENSGVEWVLFGRVGSLSNEPHMIKIYNKMILKLEQLVKKY